MVTPQPMVLSRITKKENDALRAFNQRLVTELGKQVQQVILLAQKLEAIARLIRILTY